MSAQIIPLRRYVIEYVLFSDPYNVHVHGDLRIQVWAKDSTQAAKFFRERYEPYEGVISQIYVTDYFSYFLDE